MQLPNTNTSIITCIDNTNPSIQTWVDNYRLLAQKNSSQLDEINPLFVNSKNPIKNMIEEQMMLQVSQAHEMELYSPKYFSTLLYLLASLGIIDKNMWNHGFSISKLNEHDKLSEGFCDCTGMIIVGRSKKSGKNLSLISHQQPIYHTSNVKSRLHGVKKTEVFQKSIKKALREVFTKCESRSVDSIIVGGNNMFKHKNYLRSVEQVGNIVFDELSIEPLVVGGPKYYNTKPSHVFLETQKRYLQLLQPQQQGELNVICNYKDIKKFI